MRLETHFKGQITEDRYERDFTNHYSNEDSPDINCHIGNFGSRCRIFVPRAEPTENRVQTGSAKSSETGSRHWQQLKKSRLLIRLALVLLCATSAYAQAPGGGASTFNLINQLATELQDLLLDQGGVFLSYGRIELAFIAVFGLTNIALRWQLASLNFSHQPPHIGEVYEYLIKLTFVSLLFTYYIQPLPGTNISFNHLFSAISKLLSAVLNTAIMDQVLTEVYKARTGLQQPNFYNFFYTIGYYIDIAVLSAIEIGGVLVNAFGLAITGLCALFGPLFMPLYLTKNFNRWFWRWIDNFFTYSMYRVIAIAITYLYYAIILAFFNTYVGTNYSLGHILALLPYLLLLTWAYLYSIFKVPSISAMFFQGAGLSASEVAGAAVGYLVRALI